MSKELLAQNVKGWLQIEKEMQMLQRELKQRKQKKKEYTEALVKIMKKNEIDCFDMSEGKIVFTQQKTKAPVNKHHLTECLQKYFAAKPNIPTDEIVKFILDERAVVVKENIRHKPPKAA